MPKLGPHEVAEGWVTTPAVIDDNLPDQQGYGHGTGVACVAGGLDTGVASRANLLLVKAESYFLNTKTGEKRQGGVTMAGLQDALSAIRDEASNQKMGYGKRVVNLSIVLAENSNAGGLLEFWFQNQNDEGTVIVMAAGNYGYDYMTDKVVQYQAESSPQKYATDTTPWIVVGGTYHDGSIWESTTPPGARPGSPASDATISVWAQADDVYTCDANGAPDAMRLREGTSFAAPQVAGLAAYMLMYPWGDPTSNPVKFNSRDGSVGTRMKTMLCNTYAYQRLPKSEIINQALKTLQAFPKPRTFPWAVPDKVSVIYNMIFGAQKCKDVAGFPNVKRDGDVCPLPPGGPDTSSVSYVSNAPTQFTDVTYTGYNTWPYSISTPPGVFITASFTLTETFMTTTTVTPSLSSGGVVTVTSVVEATTTLITLIASSVTTLTVTPTAPSSVDGTITLTASTTVDTTVPFLMYTTTRNSPCCPYPSDACGVEASQFAYPTYCMAAPGFEYLADIQTTTSNTGPRSTDNPY